MPEISVTETLPAVQTPDLSARQDALEAGLLVLHVTRSPSSASPDVPSFVEVPVYVRAASIVSVEPSVRANGTVGGALLEVAGGTRRCVVESAEAVVSLLARMPSVRTAS